MSDKNTIDGKIFDFAYELAMRDATMRTAFTGTTIYALLGKRNPSTKCDATSEQKENASRAKNAVWRYIEGIRTNEGYKDKDEHDAVFLRTAKKVIDAFKGYRDGSSSFTFGNAQKLINMTAKYIALGFYMDDCRENFQYCHCPMDGIMVEKVITLLEGREDIRETFGLEKRGWKGVLRDTAWSKIEKAEEGYDRFQLIVDSLRGDESVLEVLGAQSPVSRLEFDFCVWGSDEDEGWRL